MSYYVTGAPRYEEFVTDIVPDSGWKTISRQYFPLPENFPGGTIDIIAEFTKSGCTDFYGFGFVSELPENN